MAGELHSERVDFRGERDGSTTLLTLAREVAAAAAAQADPDACLRRLREGLLRVGFRRAGIWVTSSDDPQIVRGTWGTDRDGREVDEHHLVLPIGQFIASEQIFGGQRVVLRRLALPRSPDEPAHRARIAPDGPPNQACVALRADGQLIGIISVDMLPSDELIVPERIDALAIVADFVAIAIPRGRVANALRASEARYRKIVETAQEGIWIIDTAQKIVFVNQKMADMLGYRSDEMLGMPVLSFVFPEGEPQILVSIERRRQGITEQLDVKLRRKDASELWAMLRANPLTDDDGHYAGTLAMVTDISERKRVEEALAQSERHFRLLIERTTDIFVILNADGTIRYASPSITTTLGYPADDFLGRSTFDFVHPEDQELARHTLRRVIQEPGVANFTQVRCRHHDGTWRVLEATGVNLLAEPAVAGIVATLRDVTDRERLEEQLRQAQKMEAIGQLAGGVAHDFNNLLTVINGYGEMLAQRVSPQTFESEALGQIMKAGASAGSLTRQLLAFSRRQVVTPKELDLNQVVEQLGSMLRRLISEDIVFATALTPNLGLVKADPGQIEQVLLNLAANARDAMPQGGKLLIETANAHFHESDVRLHPDLAPGHYVLLAVSDNGTGMDGATQTHLFEPFFTTKEPGKGTGMGLAAVYGIVKQSGGAIDVSSEVGRGTTFRIYLPRINQPTIPAAPPASPMSRQRGTETILLVEDEKPLRAFTRTALELSGYTILEATDGVEALQIAARHQGPIDLLLTDVVMPGLGGRQVAERIIRQRPRIRVLYMSGYTDDVMVRHGVVEDGIELLQKPFTPSVLAERIRKLLDTKT